jgi:hypothetical protein
MWPMRMQIDVGAEARGMFTQLNPALPVTVEARARVMR